MRARRLTIPEIVLIGGTRAALGAGLGLLLAGRLDDDTRRGAGWALLAVGALTTIPLAVGVLGRPSDTAGARVQSGRRHQQPGRRSLGTGRTGRATGILPAP